MILTRDTLGISEREWRILRAAVLLRESNRCGCGFHSISGKGLFLYAEDLTVNTFEIDLFCRRCVPLVTIRLALEKFRENIVIDTSCPETIKEFKKYTWNAPRQEKRR